MLKKLFSHPLTRGLDIDDPHCTQLRNQIIKQKKFLCQIYKEWYRDIIKLLPSAKKPLLEIGSGGGFLKDDIPEMISSDILSVQNIDIVLDACYLPYKNSSLRGIIMIDVLHHITKPKLFFKEATRCISNGGKIIMIEPWVTPWSRFVYKNIHHEPFCSRTKKWEIPSDGPLSGANSALPWMIFKRDRDIFEKEFPELNIDQIKLQSSFSYLLSGGVSFRSFVPGFLFKVCRRIENLMEPWMDKLAMFSLIVLQRK